MKPNHSFYRQILVISLIAALLVIVAAPVSAALPTTPATGSVYISSSPSGASVFLDDVSKGVTPVTLRNIATGAHTVVVKKANYADYKKDITVLAGKTVSVSAALTPITGFINIKSTPTGASVFLDDVSKGVTPITLKSVAEGTHSVVVKKAGYADYKTDVTVVRGKTAYVTATLPATVGSISIKSTPAGASVYLDTVYKGVTPITLANIRTGDHAIVLRKSAFNNYETKVTVKANEVANIDATLVQPFSITATPVSTSARAGQVITYTININGGQGLNEQIHLTVKASAYGYSKTYDLGYISPPFPTTITKTVTMPSGVPSGVTINGLITATGGGQTKTTTVKIKSIS